MIDGYIPEADIYLNTPYVQDVILVHAIVHCKTIMHTTMTCND